MSLGGWDLDRGCVGRGCKRTATTRRIRTASASPRRKASARSVVEVSTSQKFWPPWSAHTDQTEAAATATAPGIPRPKGKGSGWELVRFGGRGSRPPKAAARAAVQTGERLGATPPPTDIFGSDQIMRGDVALSSCLAPPLG